MIGKRYSVRILGKYLVIIANPASIRCMRTFLRRSPPTDRVLQPTQQSCQSLWI